MQHGYYNEVGIQGEVTTAIRTLSAEKKMGDGKVYSIDGRLVRNASTTSHLAKGVYIVNGQKVIIK